MNLNQLEVVGPYTHENLSIFLLAGADTLDGNRFIPLDEALEQKCVTVHETGNVGQLEVENLSELFDLYIQAGDIVKGGRQDRTLGVDFVLPAKSGRVPIPSFCVESGRWHRRADEDAGSFSSSKSYLASKKLRMAAKLSKSQGEVWQKVAEAQEDLSASLDKPLYAAASPTSYQLTVEDEDLQKRKEPYRTAFAKILDDQPRAVGYAFVINGEINTADTYGSGILFRKLWSKLLDAAVLEAIAELRRKPGKKTKPVTAEAIKKWFINAENTAVFDRQEVPPRVRVDTRRGKKSVVFDTCDHGFNDAVLHKNLVAN
ncbi:MAG: DUF6569 family protein [Chthoniobacteraceae bacterium]